jgi:photosystem II stability/assembly factor-like uncharacterized protein
MNHRWAFRSLACIALALFAFVVATPRTRSEDAPSRVQQIDDLKRQIADLQKKIEELEKGGAEANPMQTGSLPADWVKALHWRSIGPAVMGGRITSISVFEADPSTYWVATASGGLVKTINNGTTFEHQFDHESTVSIGDVCVAPSDRNIVWVGTGEANPRNSVSYGDGVYKSTDGGKTWKNMGLKKSFQTGRIVIHPMNPNIVYVGALGRLYGPNEERGVYRTLDGGATWERVLYVDDKTGVIDLVMNPNQPDTLLAAMWERQRDGFDSHRGAPPLVDGYDAYDPIKKWGAGGIWKTTDGGKNWIRLTEGLPTCPLGRIGLSIYRKNPDTIFAIIDCAKIGMGNLVHMGIQAEYVEGGGVKLIQISRGGPAAKAGLELDDVVKQLDKKDIKGLAEFLNAIQGHKAGDKVTLHIQRDKESKDVEVTLENRPAEMPGAAYMGLANEDVPGGQKITELEEEGPAEKSGLKTSDVITAIDTKEIKTNDQIIRILRIKQPGETITVTVKRGDDNKDIVVKLGERPGSRPSSRPFGFMYGGQRENQQDKQGPEGREFGGVYKSTDGGESWARINSLNPRPMYFSQIRVDPSDEKHIYICGIGLYRSSDGGKTFKADGANGVHDDQHALWIDPRDGRHMLVGTDGGFYVTYDRMDHWDHLCQLALGQFYHVALDTRQPYQVYGGLQDNGSWCGPSRTLAGPGPVNEDWCMVNWGDGFVCQVDQTDPDFVYAESQDGAIARVNVRTGERKGIRPLDPRGTKYRFNWNTPFILSHHNSKIFYSAGNYVFRSVKQGDDLRVISPEIARTGRGTATALAESPLNPDVLYVGTDDGNLWVTRDGGAKWTNVAEKTGLPGPRWVASIEPSRFEQGRAYVVFDGHRSDDDEPYVYVTEDYGNSWKSLRDNLPTGSTRVLREDVVNKNLLFLGTEFAVFASVNRGENWTKINNNLPTVAVHELAIHPTSGEMVAATHGRSLWALDISPFRQMTPELLKTKTFLFEPAPAVRWRNDLAKGPRFFYGSRKFIGENPPNGVQLHAALAKKGEKVSLKVVDYAGKTVKDLPIKNEPGLQVLVWELPHAGPRNPSPGLYRAILTVDGKEYVQPVRVEADPTQPPIITSEDSAPQQTMEEDEEEEKEKAEQKKGRIDK